MCVCGFVRCVGVVVREVGAWVFWLAFLGVCCVCAEGGCCLVQGCFLVRVCRLLVPVGAAAAAVVAVVEAEAAV